MSTVTVALDVAQKEVDNLIEDVFALSEDEKAEQQDAIKRLVSNVCSGHLVIDNSGEYAKIKQILKKPVTDEDGSPFLTEVTYNTRLRAHEIKHHTKNVEIMDVNGRILAVAAAMTGKGASVLGKMQIADYKVLRAIATFFM